jgi:hypothetical protein
MRLSAPATAVTFLREEYGGERREGEHVPARQQGPCSMRRDLGLLSRRAWALDNADMYGNHAAWGGGFEGQSSMRLASDLGACCA